MNTEWKLTINDPLFQRWERTYCGLALAVIVDDRPNTKQRIRAFIEWMSTGTGASATQAKRIVTKRAKRIVRRVAAALEAKP